MEIRTDNPSIAKKSLMVQKETERKTGKDKERETGKDRERQRKRVRGMDIEKEGERYILYIERLKKRLIQRYKHREGKRNCELPCIQR